MELFFLAIPLDTRVECTVNSDYCKSMQTEVAEETAGMEGWETTGMEG